jgi:hypothetical protein
MSLKNLVFMLIWIWLSTLKLIQIQIRIRIRIISQVLHMLENHYFLVSFIHSNASSHRFIFLISVIVVINFRLFGQHNEIFWKKYSFSLLLVEMDPDPDPNPDLNRRALAVNHDPAN